MNAGTRGLHQPAGRLRAQQPKQTQRTGTERSLMQLSCATEVVATARLKRWFPQIVLVTDATAGVSPTCPYVSRFQYVRSQRLERTWNAQPLKSMDVQTPGKIQQPPHEAKHDLLNVAAARWTRLLQGLRSCLPPLAALSCSTCPK